MARLSTTQNATGSQKVCSSGKVERQPGEQAGKEIPLEAESTTRPRKQRPLKTPTHDSLLVRPKIVDDDSKSPTGKRERLQPIKSRLEKYATNGRKYEDPIFVLDSPPLQLPVELSRDILRRQTGRNDANYDFDGSSLYADAIENSLQVRGLPNARLKQDIKVIDPISPEKPKTAIGTGNISLPLRVISGNFRASTSSNEDSLAQLRFSPPRFTAPTTKTAPKPEIRDRTPSPPPSPSKGKLVSPRKQLRIPPTPHRPSIDAFWNPEVINAWNEEYSPRKALESPSKIPLSGSSDGDASFHTPTSSPRKLAISAKSPTKPDRTKQAAKKAFEECKQKIAQSFLDELEEKIGQGRVAALAASTGGVKIIWSKKLNTTGGRAHWKRDDTQSTSIDGEPMTKSKHYASIELAEKVVDDEYRLVNVLAHEYCHLTNFMISNVKNQPHGASFKAWAALVTATFATRGVQVTTNHEYQIDYKYVWTCTGDTCAAEYKRHSRSIDPARQSCGRCKGKLVQVRPAPRGGGEGEKKAGEGSEYQRFVKGQFGIVKKEMEAERGGGKSPMKDVMREVGARYRSMKGMNQHGPFSVAEVEEGGREEKLVETIGITEDGGGDELDSVARKLDFLSIE